MRNKNEVTVGSLKGIKRNDTQGLNQIQAKVTILDKFDGEGDPSSGQYEIKNREDIDAGQNSMINGSIK